MFGDNVAQGRVNTGIQEAWQEKADLIIWGSGASVSSDGENDYLKLLSQQIGLFPSQLLKFLTKTSYIELRAQNTKEEIRFALDLYSTPEDVLILEPPHRMDRLLCNLLIKSERISFRV